MPYLNDSGNAVAQPMAHPTGGKVYLDGTGEPIGGRSVRESAQKNQARIKAHTDFPEGTDTTKAGWVESSDILGTPIGAAIAHPIDAALGAAKALNPLPAVTHATQASVAHYSEAIDRLRRGKGSLMDLAALLQLPIDATSLGTVGAGQEMIKADARTRVEAGHRAIDQPLGPETSSDAFSALVPFLGPALDQAGKQQRNANPETRAEGVGGAGAIAATVAAPKMLPEIAARGAAGADASALDRMTRVTGDRPLAQEMLNSDNARMKNPPEEIARYAQDRIPQDIPEPARGQFQTNDVRQLRGQAAKYENIRDNVAPNAMPATERPSVGSIAVDAARAAGGGMYKASIPAYILRHVLGEGGAVAMDVAVGSARGAMVLGKYIKDVVNSPAYLSASADVLKNFARSVRTHDVDGIATYGQAILGNEHEQN